MFCCNFNDNITRNTTNFDVAIIEAANLISNNVNLTEAGTISGISINGKLPYKKEATPAVKRAYDALLLIAPQVQQVQSALNTKNELISTLNQEKRGLELHLEEVESALEMKNELISSLNRGKTDTEVAIRDLQNTINNLNGRIAELIYDKNDMERDFLVRIENGLAEKRNIQNAYDILNYNYSNLVTEKNKLLNENGQIILLQNNISQLTSDLNNINRLYQNKCENYSILQRTSDETNLHINCIKEITNLKNSSDTITYADNKIYFTNCSTYNSNTLSYLQSYFSKVDWFQLTLNFTNVDRLTTYRVIGDAAKKTVIIELLNNTQNITNVTSLSCIDILTLSSFNLKK